MDTPNFFASAVVVLVPMILSLSVHEYAHAWTANRLGDPTARLLGRLTLNPIAHIDLVGTILLPLMSLMGGMFFGWAKPVPVNPAMLSKKYRNRYGMMLVASAGPISNLILAFITYGIFTLLVGKLMVVQTLPEGVLVLAQRMIAVNVMLAVFNMLPIPPLDGSRVLEAFLPLRFLSAYQNFARYGFAILLVGMIIPGVFHAVLSPPYNLIMAALHAFWGLV